jgi:fluoride exporter
MAQEQPMDKVLIIGAGGFIGANARYFVGDWLARQFGSTFPLGTLIINVSGSLLLALFMGWFLSQTDASPASRLFFAVGFCGAYTTFSAYAVESVLLMQAGEWGKGILNLALNNGLCLLAAAVGLALSTRVVS